MNKALLMILLMVIGFIFGFVLADISAKYLGTQIYAFILCPVLFGIIGRIINKRIVNNHIQEK